MTTHAPDNSRRRFIKLTAIGLAAAPFASTLLSGIAGATEMVSETDPQAAALGYKADATKAEKRTDATAHRGGEAQPGDPARSYQRPSSTLTPAERGHGQSAPSRKALLSAARFSRRG